MAFMRGDTAIEVGSALSRANLDDRRSFAEAVDVVKNYVQKKMDKYRNRTVAEPGGKLEVLEKKYAHIGFQDVFYLVRMEMKLPPSAIELPRPTTPVLRRLVRAGYPLQPDWVLSISDTASSEAASMVAATPSSQALSLRPRTPSVGQHSPSNRISASHSVTSAPKSSRTSASVPSSVSAYSAITHDESDLVEGTPSLQPDNTFHHSSASSQVSTPALVPTPRAVTGLPPPRSIVDHDHFDLDDPVSPPPGYSSSKVPSSPSMSGPHHPTGARVPPSVTASPELSASVVPTYVNHSPRLVPQRQYSDGLSYTPPSVTAPGAWGRSRAYSNTRAPVEMGGRAGHIPLSSRGTEPLSYTLHRRPSTEPRHSPQIRALDSHGPRPYRPYLGAHEGIADDGSISPISPLGLNPPRSDGRLKRTDADIRALFDALPPEAQHLAVRRLEEQQREQQRREEELLAAKKAEERRRLERMLAQQRLIEQRQREEADRAAEAILAVHTMEPSPSLNPVSSGNGIQTPSSHGSSLSPDLVNSLPSPPTRSNSGAEDDVRRMIEARIAALQTALGTLNTREDNLSLPSINRVRTTSERTAGPNPTVNTDQAQAHFPPQSNSLRKDSHPTSESNSPVSPSARSPSLPGSRVAGDVLDPTMIASGSPLALQGKRPSTAGRPSTARSTTSQPQEHGLRQPSSQPQLRQASVSPGLHQAQTVGGHTYTSSQGHHIEQRSPVHNETISSMPPAPTIPIPMAPATPTRRQGARLPAQPVPHTVASLMHDLDHTNVQAADHNEDALDSLSSSLSDSHSLFARASRRRQTPPPVYQTLDGTQQVMLEPLPTNRI